MPKAFANFSPGLERQRQPWDRIKENDLTLKGFGLSGTLAGFVTSFNDAPRVVATLQLWAKISERLRRISLASLPAAQNK
jgi:hypothetical protein